MKNRKNITILDVARLARVSTATVSRCLNNSENVKNVTKQRVISAVESLGYYPNFGAKVLAAKKTNLIGAIIPTMENAIFAAGIQAFQEVLSVAGYTLLVSSSSYQRDLEEEQIYALVSRGADALLLIGEDRDPNIYEYLKQRQIPYVIAWNYRNGLQHTFIGFDNMRAAQMATEEVIKRHHKHICIIAGNTAENDRARDRRIGFIRSLEHHKIAISANQIIEASYVFEEAGDAFDTLICNNPETTAILCGNDVLAVGALLRAKKRGFNIPKQISIVGFDDIEISNIVSPKLSTVHVPHRQMGRHSAQSIINMLNGSPEGTSLELKPHFVQRESLS